MKKIMALIAALLVLCCAGCGQRAVQLSSFALDTEITVRIHAGGDEQDAEAALARIDACERLLSAHREGSDIAAVNASGGQPVRVDALTARVLERALTIGRETEGALDVTLLAVSALWDYRSESPRVPPQQQIDEALRRKGMERILIEDNVVVADGVGVDLGAVAKGAIGDEAVETLRARGVTSALLNLGGNILTLGSKPDGSDWVVAIEDPMGGGSVGTVAFSGSRAVATSSGAQRYFEVDGVRYHHILDPETGYPAGSGIASATVLASDGLTADALSTALFVMGEARAERLLREVYPDCAAVLVRDDGTVRVLGDVRFAGE